MPVSVPPLLAGIDSPADLRALAPAQLPRLADEVRRFLLETVAKSGGHLAAGLGTVELAIALHYVLDTPTDPLIWDTGHQAYPHKILTGRRDRLESIRRQGGISGFLSRAESEYDTFGAGHASTAISAALGFAAAAARLSESREVVAVVGDGALSGGQAYEALNNAGSLDADLLVVLNDNEMSIEPSVGGIANYLARVLSGRAYSTVREGSRAVLSTLPPPFKHLAKRSEEHLKGMLMPGTLFEELGFYYIGPIDGHDLDVLTATLRNMRKIRGPRFLHVVTRKGHGFEPATQNPLAFHGVSAFSLETGKVEAKPAGRTYSQVFGDWLCDTAETDPKLVAITPAMGAGSGMQGFAARFPDRYFDVGIAEPHALTFAGGLACAGCKPVVAIYSTFLQRAYDQLIHDLSLQKLDVTLAIDRAGLVGADGATHAGAYDLSFLRCVPDILLMAPSDERECRQMLSTAYQHPGLAAVRYPRGSGPGAEPSAEDKELEIGRGLVVQEGTECALLVFGTLLAQARPVAESQGYTLVNMRFIKPLDTELVARMADSHRLLVTIEDNVVAGGAGAAVNEALAEAGLSVAVLNLGLPDRPVDHATQTEQYKECGLDSEGIKKAVLQRINDS